VPLKRHSRNLWRNTEELGGHTGTWWRARRETQPSWRGLGLQWSRDVVRKERMGRQRAKMKRRGPRVALEKVKRRRLHYLPPIRIVVFVNRILIIIFFL